MGTCLKPSGNDPGPCIVCGAPHTICTGDSGNVAMPIRRPFTMPVPPRPVVARTSPPFTTATYDRERHGKRRRPR